MKVDGVEKLLKSLKRWIERDQSENSMWMDRYKHLEVYLVLEWLVYHLSVPKIDCLCHR